MEEVFVRIRGQHRYLWQAVDQDGEVVDVLLQERRDAASARRFFRHPLARLVAHKLQLEWSPRQIATLVERQTRYLILAKVLSKDGATVVNALINRAHKLPRELYKSLTWDRGSEMAENRRFRLATDIQVYFCDPQQPWQRGSNENTNGLLRQYLPKGMDLSNPHQNRLNAIARRLNERPRETLDFETPAGRFSQSIASIG